MQRIYSLHTDYFLPCLLEYENTEIDGSIIFKPVAAKNIYLFRMETKDLTEKKLNNERHLNMFVQQIFIKHPLYVKYSSGLRYKTNENSN